MADPPYQPSLFTADVVAQPATPWWACLGGCVAAAGVAEGERLARQRKAARSAELTRLALEKRQARLVAEVEPLVPLPRTVADCRSSGICPKFGCEFNVVLHVKDISDDAQTISVGGRGGNGHGASIATRRDRGGKVEMADLDAMVDAALELIDTLPSTCVLDYIENPDLMRVEDDETVNGPIGAHMTLAAIARVFGVTREGMRRTELAALHKAKRTPAADELAPDFVPADRLVRR